MSENSESITRSFGRKLHKRFCVVPKFRTGRGKSMLTVIVPDLEASRAALRSRQLLLGPSTGGDCAPRDN